MVERGRQEGVTGVHVERVKCRHLGDKGVATFVYNRTNGRFTREDAEFDNDNWLGTAFLN